MVRVLRIGWFPRFGGPSCFLDARINVAAGRVDARPQEDNGGDDTSRDDGRLGESVSGQPIAARLAATDQVEFARVRDDGHARGQSSVNPDAQRLGAPAVVTEHGR